MGHHPRQHSRQGLPESISTEGGLVGEELLSLKVLEEKDGRIRTGVLMMMNTEVTLTCALDATKATPACWPELSIALVPVTRAVQECPAAPLATVAVAAAFDANANNPSPESIGALQTALANASMPPLESQPVITEEGLALWSCLRPRADSGPSHGPGLGAEPDAAL